MAKFEINRGITNAKIILDLIMDGCNELADRDDIIISVGSYKNGRENGYTFSAMKFDGGGVDLNFVIAEFRSSDDIVVYMSNGRILSDGRLNDDIYENRRHYPYGYFNEVAEIIMGKLLAEDWKLGY